MLNLDAMRRRHERATSGPWAWAPDIRSDCVITHGTRFVASALRAEDAMAICAARDDVGALIDEVNRLRGILIDLGYDEFIGGEK